MAASGSRWRSSARDGYWKCPRPDTALQPGEPRLESMTCQTITAEHVECTAIVLAKRWIDDSGTRKQARGLRGVFIRDVNAADRTDFARQRVLHTTLMEPVTRNAPAGRIPVGEVAPALTATTAYFPRSRYPRPANAAARTAGIRNGTPATYHPADPTASGQMAQ
jgi:hypothetical protein